MRVHACACMYVRVCVCVSPPGVTGAEQTCAGTPVQEHGCGGHDAMGVTVLREAMGTPCHRVWALVGREPKPLRQVRAGSSATSTARPGMADLAGPGDGSGPWPRMLGEGEQAVPSASL